MSTFAIGQRWISEPEPELEPRPESEQADEAERELSAVRSWVEGTQSP